MTTSKLPRTDYDCTDNRRVVVFGYLKTGTEMLTGSLQVIRKELEGVMPFHGVVLFYSYGNIYQREWILFGRNTYSLSAKDYLLLLVQGQKAKYIGMEEYHVGWNWSLLRTMDINGELGDRTKWYLIKKKIDVKRNIYGEIDRSCYEILGSWRKFPKTHLKQLEEF